MNEQAEQSRNSPVVSVPRVALMGLQSGSGLSTVTTGVIGALRKLRLSVGVLKLGAPLEQLAHYRRLTGRLCFSLHPWNAALHFDSLATVARASVGAEILLVEGQEGIFDLFPAGYGVDRPSELLYDLQIPTIVVLQGPELCEGIAAVAKGVMNFDPRASVKGVLVINTTSREIEARQRAALQQLEEETGLAFLGVVPKSSKELVDYSSDASSGTTRARILTTVELIEQSINIKKLRAVAELAPPLYLDHSFVASKSRGCRIGVADDVAMHTMFQENLDLLRREGAELIPFSPLNDAKLPPSLRGVYLPGGPVDEYAEQLSQNRGMIDELRLFIRSGGLVYSEGSSVAYLSRKLMTGSGQTFEMVGALPMLASFLERFQEDRSFERVIELRANRTDRLLRDRESFRGFQESRWALRLEDSVNVCFEAYTREHVTQGAEYLQENPPSAGGFQPRANVIATPYLVNWATCPRFADRFVTTALSGLLP